MKPTISRTTAAIMIGVAAIAAASLAARGPATPEQAAFSWPPARLPADSPTRTWLSPLLVARHYAETIDARVPCGAVPLIRDTPARQTVLFSTTRRYTANRGLAVIQSPDHDVVVKVGTRELARTAAKPRGACSVDIRTSGNRYVISAHGRRLATGSLPKAPTVFGFLTELDLRARPGLDVEIRPAAEDTSPTGRQTALRILAALLVGAAVALLVTPTFARRRPTIRRPRPTAQDGLVGSSLLVWWFLAPIQDDDGWVRARQVNSLVSGGFSNYYESWGANLPLDAWYEWLQHWVVANSTSLALQRLPSVVLLLAAWLVCRRCLVGLLGARPDRRSVPWWCAAAAFVVGASAFGFTLRPEPGIALLASLSLLCCLRFARSPSVAPLLFAVLAAGMATTVHPAGLVVAAPILLCIPQAIRATRAKQGFSATSLVAVVAVGVAWGLLLSYLDFDTRSRADDVALVSGAGHNYGIPGEYNRYLWLSEFGASPLRRETVVMLLLCVLALFAVVPWRRRTLVERLPAASIGLSLVLLTITPSKWIWHFGTLIGFATVAVGFEASMLGTARITARARWAVAFLFVLTGAWAAGGGQRWGPFDTMRVDWSNVRLGALVIGVSTIAVLVVRLGRMARPEIVALPVVLLTLFVATTTAFATDAAIADGWTASRQSLRSLIRSDRCGLASDLAVPLPGTMRPLPSIRTVAAGSPAPQRSDQARHVPRPARAGRWHSLGRDRVGIWVSGFDREHGLIVTWGRRQGSHVAILRSAVVRDRQALPGSIRSSWRFVSQRGFPARPPEADALRITKLGQAGGTRMSAPMSYEIANLGLTFAGRNVQPLISPFLYAAVPCASPPELVYGVAEVPDVLIDWNQDSWTALGNWSSPFLGLSDALDIRRVPIDNWQDRRTEIQVHWVRVDPRDALAPATRRLVAN
jgi:hypothetical protein